MTEHLTGALYDVGVDQAVAQVLARVEGGERLKTVCREVAARTGLSAKVLYDTALGSR